ncbi:DNA internalization-related competence protein ComEC/Rec2 [Neobacillus sp. LXY-4]|uniref:DNA internalization-related competence protein ComEC/Rec2 n=1 Tax=Neobacillus sp. LXY-4 TaxID=3379826 RepID=UPI003EDFBFBE
MKGKGIFVAVSGLLGVCCALLDFTSFMIVFLIYAVFLYSQKSFSKSQFLFLLFTFFLYSMIGNNVNLSNQSQISDTEEDFTVLLQQWKMDGDRLQIEGKDVKTKEKLLIQYRFKSLQEKVLLEKEMKAGLKCNLSGKLESPSSARNPNTFNFKKYLASKKIHWILTPEQFPLQSCSSFQPSFHNKIQNIRSEGIHYVATHFPEPLASLSIALLFGEQALIEEDLMSSYQKLGIIHLLAISGLQVSFLTGVIFFCGIRIGVVRERMVTILLVFLPLYALLTGATPSVVRAVTMMLIILVSLRFGNNRILPLDALSGTLLLLLLAAPLQIFDVGFQLSFTASAALLLSVPIVKDNSNHIQLLLTSFIAQLATLPIILYHFYEFSFLSLLANFLFVPFFSVFLTPYIFFIFILHPLIGVLFTPLLALTNQTIILVNSIIERLSNVPFQTLTLGRPGLVLLLIYLLVVVFTFYKMQTEPKKMIKHCLFVFLPLSLQLGSNIFSPFGEITFIDVGQGDAIFIKLPFHQGNYLIDSGGTIPYTKEKWQQRNSNFEVGADIVVPFLKGKGINRLNKLILTHGDFDHVGGSKAIIEEFKVDEIILPMVKEQSELEGKVVAIAKQKEIPITFISEGDGWEAGGAVFEVLSPRVNGQENGGNDGSIVIQSEMGGLTWLFTGDIEKNKEMNLVKKYPFLDIDVLKLAHHGSHSSTSEELLSQFKPEIAIISVGENNRYGHPHQGVISRLEHHRIRIFRTDEQGAISYFFKDGRGTFSMAVP